MRVIIKPGGVIAIGLAFVIPISTVFWQKAKAVQPAEATPGAVAKPRVDANSTLPGSSQDVKGEIVPVADFFPAEGGQKTAVTAQLINGADYKKVPNGFSVSLSNSEKQFAEVGSAIVDTSHSFSVSAWVRFKTIGGFQTLVSQDGQSIAGFYLQKRQDSGRLAFTLNSNDAMHPDNPGAAVPAAGYRAQSSFSPIPYQWYHLVGVYDETAHEVRLYVNGKLEQATKLSPEVKLWQAQGSTVIGAALWESKRVDHSSATIENVQLYGRAISEDDVTRLYKER